MPRGVIGESGADRATDKMDKWISRSNGQNNKPLSLLEQFQKSYPNTWEDEIKKAKAEQLKRREEKEANNTEMLRNLLVKNKK